MTDSIKLSPKHGLNPCIPICFFCGEQKNEVALLGKLANDDEAPMKAVLNYEPCNTCKEIMDKGVTLIEVGTMPCIKNQPPIQNDFYPTGRYCVITLEAANRIFSDKEHSLGDKMLVDAEIGDAFFKN